MSIHRLNKRDKETFTVQLNPKRTYTSGSGVGTTGSITLFARGSSIQKDVRRLGAFDETDFDDTDLDTLLKNAKNSGATNIESSIEDYMSTVNDLAESARNDIALEIVRKVPGTSFNDNMVVKGIIKNIMMPFQRPSQASMNYAYSNYHSLNFMTGASMPEDACLMYPNTGSQYTTTGAFTFDFYINPRHHFEDAGVIAYLSSSFMLSLHTSSLKNGNNEAESFSLKLQLSHSADYSPTTTPGNFPNDLIFESGENTLSRNHWHHVTIRWGTDNTMAGSGSFIIDRVEQGTFIIPSASLNDGEVGEVLCIGNGGSGAGDQTLLFNQDVANRDGVLRMNVGTTSQSSIDFPYPLNAEIHDFKIFDTYRLDRQQVTSSLEGPGDLTDLRFYLPPFFIRTAPTRSFVGDHGGMLITPFQTEDATSREPFNVKLSFGVGGRDINLENFVRDIAGDIAPRCFMLTSSAINTTTDVLTANQFLRATGSFEKRQTLVVPCDNGLFMPNFNLIRSGNINDNRKPTITTNQGLFVDDAGTLNLSFVNMSNMLGESGLDIKFFSGIFDVSGTILDDIAGAKPTNLSASMKNALTVYQRTKDPSSNEVTFFDISNLFYGHAIKPESLVLTDTSFFTTSFGTQMVLRDDGSGNIYRADAATPHAKWATVGNVFYEEGIVFIKSPHIAEFGAEQFQVDLEGEHTIHTTKYYLVADADVANSSSNPSFTVMSSSLANEDDEAPVLITGINFHDKNMNVIMRSNLAQHIYKKNSDRISFRPKLDW